MYYDQITVVSLKAKVLMIKIANQHPENTIYPPQKNVLSTSFNLLSSSLHSNIQSCSPSGLILLHHLNPTSNLL